VLREIRTAVLNNDNPFTLDASAVLVPPAPPREREAAEPPEAEDRSGITFSVPASPQEDEPAPEPTPIRPSPAPRAQQPAAPPQPAPPIPAEAPAHGGRDWNLLTVAGLMLWAEDAAATLGADRLRMVLELASFAELVPPDARDVLVRAAQLATRKDPPQEPASVIDCVVVLHQLEAVLHGEMRTRLPRREERLGRAA
jgi:hypothetical protein